MSLDLTKLTPAPWCVRHGELDSSVFCGSENPLDAKCGFHLPGSTDAAFIALARNAFDVMMRRKFSPEKVGENEFSVLMDGETLGSMWIGFTDPYTGKRLVWADPFTALVEADEWYRENVEKQPVS